MSIKKSRRQTALCSDYQSKRSNIASLFFYKGNNLKNNLNIEYKKCLSSFSIFILHQFVRYVKSANQIFFTQKSYPDKIEKCHA